MSKQQMPRANRSSSYNTWEGKELWGGWEANRRLLRGKGRGIRVLHWRDRMALEEIIGRRGMSNVLIHKARELKAQTRAAVEAELGRPLKDDEDVSIMAFEAHEAPTGEARSRAGQKLETYFKRIDEQTATVTEEDAESALQEALKRARPGYREEE
jgi:hypothetical protein